MACLCLERLAAVLPLGVRWLKLPAFGSPPGLSWPWRGTIPSPPSRCLLGLGRASMKCRPLC